MPYYLLFDRRGPCVGITKVAQTVRVRPCPATGQRGNRIDPVVPPPWVLRNSPVLMPKEINAMCPLIVMMNLVLESRSNPPNLIALDS